MYFIYPVLLSQRFVIVVLLKICRCDIFVMNVNFTCYIQLVKKDMDVQLKTHELIDNDFRNDI